MQTPSAPLRREVISAVTSPGTRAGTGRRAKRRCSTSWTGARATASGLSDQNTRGVKIAAGADVCLELSRMTSVEPFVKDGRHFVRVGAGCTLQTLLDKLHAATDQTLPTFGAVKKQTIAGAISTGTHGSGLQSLSHFVTNVRIAGASLEPPRRSTTTLGQALSPAGCRYRTPVSRDGKVSRLVSAQRFGRRLQEQVHGESARTGPPQAVTVVAGRAEMNQSRSQRRDSSSRHSAPA
jgi:hypothetical protein